jgi:hypothetical protein
VSSRRIDYYDAPEAPKANGLVPSVNVVVVNDAGEMVESMKLLDDSLSSAVSMLTDLSPERIEELGGTGDWED